MNSESVRDILEIIKALKSERRARLVFLNDHKRIMECDAVWIAKLEKELERVKAKYAADEAYLANPYPTIDAIDQAIARQRLKLAEPALEQARRVKEQIAELESKDLVEDECVE